jgi:hypothetical protein
VEARAFIRAVKKGTTFVIYTTSIIEPVKGLEALLTRYKEYQVVFENKNVDLLFQHCPYDCTIDLHESTQSSFGPIYNLSPNELVALQEYLDENLAKNLINIRVVMRTDNDGQTRTKTRTRIVAPRVSVT